MQFRAARARLLLAALSSFYLAILSSDIAAGRETASGIESVSALLRDGRYADAEAAARGLLVEAESAHGTTSIEAAAVLDALVESLWRGGKAKDPPTKLLAERAVSIKESCLGTESPEVARSLNNLATVLAISGEFEEARSTYQRALAIREAALGPDHPDVARTLSNIADLLWKAGDLGQARSHVVRALSILEKALGPEHPDMARVINRLGVLDMSAGDYAAAEPLFTRALDIQGRALGQEHPEFAATLNNLALVQKARGDFAAARENLDRVRRIDEKRLGPNHPDAATTLINIGNLLRDSGDYAAARPLYEQAISALEKALGPDHAELANPLTGLADLVAWTGDLDRARGIHQRALAISEKALGPDHPRVATVLNNLGVVLQNMGVYEQAKPLFLRALEIREKALGPAHPDVAKTLNNLANLMTGMGDSSGARPLRERTVEIREKSLGPDHPDLARALSNLAELLWTTGDTSAARPLYDRAITILEKSVGPDHPDTARCLLSLSKFEFFNAREPLAFETSLRAERIARAHFHHTAQSLSERDALSYERLRSSGLDLALTILAYHTSGPAPDALWKVWDAVVLSRAMVLDELSTRHRLANVEPDPEILTLAKALQAARNRLARLEVKGPDPRVKDAYPRQIQAALDDKERAERALAQKSGVFRRELDMEGAGIEAVASTLPSRSVLISYVEYGRLMKAPDPAGDGPGLSDLSPADGSMPSAGPSASEPADRSAAAGGNVPPPVSSYIAFVLRAGSRSPAAIPLGPAEEIDALIATWRREAATQPPGLKAAADLSEIRCAEAGERLRRAIWDPLADHTEGARQIFVVPEGALNLVNLAALPRGRDRYLVESGAAIHYLSTERDLLRQEPVTTPVDGLLAMGGPDFDSDPGAGSLEEPHETASASAPASSANSAAAETYRGPTSKCDPMRSMRFSPLPATLLEARDLAALWAGRSRGTEVLQLTGRQATEAAFKRLAGRHRIVHLATHGFFADEECSSILQSARADEREHGPRSVGENLAPVAGENPLLLSGVALSGANRRGEASQDGREEDGILTAEEIASLDLSGVQWVVLSACETGVGRVQSGEGVLGLRRAFEIAEAGTLIMSLWSVQDEATRAWMRHLYEGRVQGLSTAESVRNAALKALVARRRSKQTTHPFYWGAFVAAGDWR